MNLTKKLNLPFANAICYSGFREGQQPGGEYPTYNQIKEDLLILQQTYNQKYAHSILSINHG